MPAEDSAALRLLRADGSAVAIAAEADARPAEKMELALCIAPEALVSTDAAAGRAPPTSVLREPALPAEMADWSWLLIEAARSVFWAET